MLDEGSMLYKLIKYCVNGVANYTNMTKFGKKKYKQAGDVRFLNLKFYDVTLKQNEYIFDDNYRFDPVTSLETLYH